MRDESQMKNSMYSPRVVRFYSLRSHSYVHDLRFRSTVYMVRCSPWIVVVGLGLQIYCFDALTLENKFSVLTYPVSQMGGGQGLIGVNIGYGPMSVGQVVGLCFQQSIIVKHMALKFPKSDPFSRRKSFNFTQ